MSDWQPIESAPKDVKRILIGWWDETEWECRAAFWDTEEDEPVWTDGAVDSWGYEEVQVYNPTHWQHLPTPP